jgi:hypothetical protein
MSKKINENPTIADDVLFEFETPDADGCLLANPYRVDTVKIFYIERNFSGGNYGSLINEIPDTDLQADLALALEVACDDPTEDNLANVTFIQNELELNTNREVTFFSEAKVVKQNGNSTNPAWLSTGDEEDFEVELVSEDTDGFTQYGHFQLLWSPLGMRLGNYVIQWTWTPFASSPNDKISNYISFSLGGATQLTTSIPTHFTDPEKYSTLLERYRAEMFKMTLSDVDLSPWVLLGMDESVGDGFKFLEDLANQTIDLIDANAVSENFLPILADTFSLQLRSEDPTLWRRQIKRAVPLFKQKGTLKGLNSALSQANIILKKLTIYWQVISSYTYQEHFNVIEDYETEFNLTKTALIPVDSNFEMYYRADDSETWTELVVANHGTFTASTVTWTGATAPTPLALMSGDSIRVVYKTKEIPDASEQTLETYIRSLPISDQRDERDQLYPPKNWNVRLIEEDDALFDDIIQDRNPYFDQLVYGDIRTEFPYSENIYNMEEYNGSKRESTNPCDIDKDFVDPCTGGISSKFSVDIEIENISNERVLEAQEIIQEFKPFHAVLHSINLLGSLNEFIEPPIEQITTLIQVDRTDVTLVDPVQTIFNRSMKPSTYESILRDTLATSTTVVPAGTAGTGSNSDIALFAPDILINAFTPDLDDDTLTRLRVLAPSANAGTYSIDNPTEHNAIISGALPPETPLLNTSSFTFRLSNEILRQTAAVTITQSDVFSLSDSSVDFAALGVQSERDVIEGFATNPYTIDIPAYGGPFNIEQILPDGSLILETDGSLPTVNTTGITYTLLDGDGGVVATSITGVLSVKRRAIVILRDNIGDVILIRGNAVTATTLDDIRNYVSIGNYAVYNGDEYFISGFIENETLSFYIDGYTDGSVSGVTVIVEDRVIENETGYFNYRGPTLTTVVNYETGLDIQNGTNPPAVPVDGDIFKENFLILIGSDYYGISEIDGTTVTLSGQPQNWPTGGTPITFSILQFEKDEVSIAQRIYPPQQGYDFESIDRRGQEIIEYEIETATSLSMLGLPSALSTPGEDHTMQQESINFIVEWADEGE